MPARSRRYRGSEGGVAGKEDRLPAQGRQAKEGPPAGQHGGGGQRRVNEQRGRVRGQSGRSAGQEGQGGGGPVKNWEVRGSRASACLGRPETPLFPDEHAAARGPGPPGLGGYPPKRPASRRAFTFRTGPDKNVFGYRAPHAVGGGRATWVGLCHRGQGLNRRPPT